MSPGPDPASDLAGRTALVTGGGTGIGRVVTEHLVRQGVRVVVVGRRAEPLVALQEAHPGQVRAEVCDVADVRSVDDLSERLADEEISVLINNAGIGGPVSHLVDIDPQEWDEVMAVNVRGVFLACRAFLPPMLDRGQGDVVNLASVTGKRPLEGRTPYCASKMAVLGLTSTLAFEVGPRGVRVNALSPGPVEGERMDRNFRLEAERAGGSEEDARKRFVDRAASGRMVTEDEVADAVVAILRLTGLNGADVDLSAGMIA